MTLDGGWGLIIATVIGVLLVWIGGLVTKHFGNNEESTDDAHGQIAKLYERINSLQSDFQRYQTHVAENYVRTPALERIEKKLDRLLERGNHNEPS